MTDTPRRRLGGAPARYQRRVTSDDIGSRVTVRHLIPDDERGTRPTDAVGRLLAFDDDLLLIVDRHGQLHTIPTGQVMASKVVPEHPKLEAEPRTTSPQAPLRRDAARVLLLDADDRVLLVGHRPREDRTVWTAPGGGTDPGEAPRDAAARELREEIGVDVQPGACAFTRRAVFCFRGVWIEQHEQWFLARVEALDASDAPLTDAAIDRARWWRLDEMRSSDAEFAPPTLADEIERLLRDGPADPWHVEG